MCQIAKVSKSGYYKWLKTKDLLKPQEIIDNVLVKAIFYRNKKKYGVRRIKMELSKMDIVMNRKKISRIMKEQNLQTIIRRKNPYKTTIKDVLSGYYCENVLMQDFRNRKPLEAFGIDITYLKYNNRFAYVCSMIDVKTSEIVSYGISDNLKQDFVLGTVEYAIRNISRLRTSTIIIHSDRGSHFRAKSYKELLEKHNIIQSMSAPGNPKDNAVIESFFGHMKDEINLKKVKTFDEVVELVHDYMYYYNNDRKQWNKNKMTPIEYRKFLMAS